MDHFISRTIDIDNYSYYKCSDIVTFKDIIVKTYKNILDSTGSTGVVHKCDIDTIIEGFLVIIYISCLQ